MVPRVPVVPVGKRTVPTLQQKKDQEVERSLAFTKTPAPIPKEPERLSEEGREVLVLAVLKVLEEKYRKAKVVQ